MRFAFATAALLLFALWAQALAQSPPKRRIPCKTPENAASCYWIHGRIRVGDGTPAYRLWKVGTKRLLGIYSGPSVYPTQLIDNENPEFPANAERIWTPRLGSPLYGDFEVCPLAPERRGFMRPVCVESAQNLFVDRAEYQ
jgi:hypothetical protein